MLSFVRNCKRNRKISFKSTSKGVLKINHNQS